jgi:hypothetical protein
VFLVYDRGGQKPKPKGSELVFEDVYVSERLADGGRAQKSGFTTSAS